MFDTVTESRLNPADFHQKIEFLIDGFIPRRLITMFYAEGGSGKSWLAYAVAKYAAQDGQRVIYLDYDNPISVLAERGLDHKLIEPHTDNLYYISSSKADLTSEQMIGAILNEGGNLDGTVLILDSLRDFCDVRNDNQTLQFMAIVKTLRERGATVIILSHSNKDARNYEGSNNIYNSLDNMYQLKKADEAQDRINYLFNARKNRAGAAECAWSLDTNTLTIEPMDIESVRLSAEDKAFIEQIKAVLKDQPGINKKELLAAVGIDKRDKTANKRLEKFDGIHWRSQKSKNVYTYQIIAATATTDPTEVAPVVAVAS